MPVSYPPRQLCQVDFDEAPSRAVELRLGDNDRQVVTRRVTFGRHAAFLTALEIATDRLLDLALRPSHPPAVRPHSYFDFAIHDEQLPPAFAVKARLGCEAVFVIRRSHEQALFYQPRQQWLTVWTTRRPAQSEGAFQIARLSFSGAQVNFARQLQTHPLPPRTPGHCPGAL